MCYCIIGEKWIRRFKVIIIRDIQIMFYQICILVKEELINEDLISIDNIKIDKDCKTLRCGCAGEIKRCLDSKYTFMWRKI